MDRRILNASWRESRRSLASESQAESDAGSLLSGLSQARKIPDRRKNSNGRGGLRSMPKSSNGAAANRSAKDVAKLKQKNDGYRKELPSIIKLQAFARGYIVRFAYRSQITMEKTKRRFFAIQLQAFVRGFLQRERYLKMTGKKRSPRKVPKISNTDRTGLRSPRQTRKEATEKKNARSKTPNFVGGPFDRRRKKDELGDSEMDAGSVVSNAASIMSNLSQARRIPDRRKRADQDSEMDASVASMMSNLSMARKIPDRRKKLEQDSEMDASVASAMSNLSMARKIPDRRKKKTGDDSEMDGSVVSIMSNLSMARKIPDRRKKHETGDPEMDGSVVSIMSNLSMARKIPDRRKKVDDMGDSHSEVGSVMSNLSVARKVPDRRKKREARDAKAVKIQALARGYIQRLLYRSIVAMSNTKKKFASITIQAYMRGFLQRKNAPEVSRKHVAPKREPLPGSSILRKKPSRNSESEAKDKPARVAKRKPEIEERATKINRKAPLNSKTMRKPTRQRSNSKNDKPSRQLTIRKPKRHTSDSDESHDVPVKQFTIRKPRRQQKDESEGSDDAPVRRVTVGGARSAGKKKGRIKTKDEISPPRKVMVKTKKGKRPEGEMDKSEESLEPEKAVTGRSGRVDRRVMSQSQSITSDRLAESESDVGSLMSGLSQARKVPDRRLKRGAPSRGGAPVRDEKMSKEKEAERTKNATKIQAVGRGYMARFVYRSVLTLEQTKKKFFAVQIQSLARGYLVRSRRKK